MASKAATNSTHTNASPVLVPPADKGSGVVPDSSLTSKGKVVFIEPCPECGKDDFASNAERGRHLRARHNIRGSSPTAKQRHKREIVQSGGIDFHDGVEKPGLTTPNGQAQAPDALPQFPIGFATGFIQCFLQLYSNEAEIAQNELTDQVVRFLRGETHR